MNDNKFLIEKYENQMITPHQLPKEIMSQIILATTDLNTLISYYK